MGNDAELASALSSAMGNLATASGTLNSSVDTFSAVAKRIEQRFQELGAKDASLEQREQSVIQQEKALEEKQKGWVAKETEIRELSKELEQRKMEWDGIEKKMEANAAKIKHVVHLDVGGQRFPTTKATLLKHSGSFFASMLLTNHSQQAENGDFFIDHNPRNFGLILDFLRDGQFQNADLKAADLKDLEKEFEFFKIPKHTLFKDMVNPIAAPAVANPIPAPATVNPVPAPAVDVQPNQILPFEGGTLLSQDLKKKITEWLPQQKFSLLYKASRDGFDGTDFHGKCDNQGCTITIIKSQGGYLFGGFTSQSWDGGLYKADPTSFLFTLTNPHSLPPTQYPIKPDQVQNAIGCHPSYCATFGIGHDIDVSPASHQNNTSYTSFPHTFTDTTGKGETTFTGARNFTTSDVEVYRVSK